MAISTLHPFAYYNKTVHSIHIFWQRNKRDCFPVTLPGLLVLNNPLFSSVTDQDCSPTHHSLTWVLLCSNCCTYFGTLASYATSGDGIVMRPGPSCGSQRHWLSSLTGIPPPLASLLSACLPFASNSSRIFCQLYYLLCPTHIFLSEFPFITSLSLPICFS